MQSSIDDNEVYSMIKLIAEYLPVGMSIVDSDGIVVYENNHMEELYDFSLVGMPLYSYVTDSDARNEFALNWKNMESLTFKNHTNKTKKQYKIETRRIQSFYMVTFSDVTSSEVWIPRLVNLKKELKEALSA